MRIGIVGIRGLPPSYGGYETFTDHFVKYFTKKGHKVMVACESPESGEKIEKYNGADLVYFPFKPPKRYSLRKIYEGLNDIFFYFKLARKCDIMYILAGLGTQFLPLIKLINPKLKIVTNNDGLEWEREKYSRIEKILWKSFIRSSLRWSNLVIFDNSRLSEFFPPHNLKKSLTIEYGVSIFNNEIHDEGMFEISKKYNNQLSDLIPDEYYIVVARLQKDNNTHLIIDGFLKSKSEKKLIIVGNSLDQDYQNYLNHKVTEKSNKEIIFTGGIYDKNILDNLRYNSYAYIHGHSAGGTNPALLEAMSLGKAIIAFDNPFNPNVLNNKDMLFLTHNDLSERINFLEENNDYREQMANQNLNRAKKKFSWERCFMRHEKIFLLLLNKNH